MGRNSQIFSLQLLSAKHIYIIFHFGDISHFRINRKIVETQNPENIVYQVDAIKAPGDQWGNNFSNESRIGEGFEKTAKSFGKLIIKRTKQFIKEQLKSYSFSFFDIN